MFVVCKKLSGESRWCILICQSVREGKKVRQKTLKYYGVAHGDKQRQLLANNAKQEIEHLKNAQASAKKPQAVADDPCHGVLLSNTIECSRVVEGFHAVLGPIFDSIGLSPLFTKIRYNQLRDVVIARIAQPASKLRTAQVLQTSFLRPLSENQIYKLMDQLIDLEDAIIARVFATTQKLIEQQVIDLLLFDVTTLYFESQKSDELRDFGYSKDHKIGETQVVLALATTKAGAPIGYQLFRGNTAEVGTLLQCLEKWREIFDIQNVIVVADRAMMSNNNLLALEEAGLTYVIAAKLKKLPQKLQEAILQRKEHNERCLNEEVVCIQEHDHENRRLIVEYSENRAEKDARDRDRLINKVRKKLSHDNKTNPRKLVTNQGYLKFLDEEKEGKVVLNEEKILADKRWDGLHGIITNDKSTDPLELLGRYRNLWVIEESFRINKHTLSMRPIYHFTERRIRAHILICYLAFAVVRYVHQRVNIFEQSISIEQMRDALSGVEVSILEEKTTGLLYRLPSQLSKEATMIYRTMGIQRCSRPSKYIVNSRNCSVTKKT